MKITPAFSLIAAVLSASLSSAQAAPPTALDRSAAALANEHWIAALHLSKAALADAALSQAETIKALNNLCVAEAKVGRYDEALEACAKGIALKPDLWATYINRGNLRAMMGNIVAARADYAKAKTLNPANQTVGESAALKLRIGTVKTAPFIAYAGDAPPIQTAGTATGE